MGFAFCDETVFCNNTTYFISCANPETLLYIAQFLNHKLYDWYYRTSSVQLGSSAVRMFSIYVLCLPVAKELKENNIYKTFGLTCDEINFIESQ